MNKSIIITAGEHRNEKSAAILGPSVVKELRKLSYQVKFFENPEKRTLREIALEAHKKGGGIRRKELNKILFHWEENLSHRYRSSPIFNLHNYGMNPTEFELDKELKEELESMEVVYESLDLGSFAKDSLAHKVKFCGGCKGALIEIPAIDKTSLSQEEKRFLRKMFHPKTFKLYCSYLLETDIKETEKQGFLSQKMVEILTRGIDFLIKTNHNWED